VDFPGSVTRRDFIKGAGGLVIGFSLLDATISPELLAQSATAKVVTPPAGRLDAWLRVTNDGVIHIFSGKMDVGTGTETALKQIVAEELDVPFERVVFIMGDTATTPDQGGVSNSRSISHGGAALISVAATARMLLLQLASKQLGVAVDQLQINDGIINAKGDASKKVGYGALVEGKELNDTLKVTGEGFSLAVEGQGKPKEPSAYTIVGKSIPRVDIPPKIFGEFSYVTDVRVPGMLHGRVIRPATAGANFVSVDETAVKKIPGFVKTVTKGNFVGVVAENEWAAVRASREVRVSWSNPNNALPQDLYNHMRQATPKSTQAGGKKGDAAAALLNAAKKLQVSYEWPFQAHATMGPGCAIVDYRADGVTTVWSGTMKPHALRTGIAELIARPVDQVHVIWVQDSGAYGRSGHDDTAGDAALLSQAIGKPVRVQWMREDMTAWGGKGPAVVMDIVAGFDSAGQITAVQWESRAFSGNEFHWAADRAGSLIAGQLTGLPNSSGNDEFVHWVPAYDFPNTSSVAHIIAPLVAAASPMRTMHLRAPQGPARTFASESFIDELATAGAMDPLEYRLKYLSNDRAKSVLLSATERAKWQRRPSPNPARGDRDIATGRGLAFGGGGAGTTLATVAEVEVNRRTGAIQVKRLICAHDCGRVVNPDGLRDVVAANLVQSLSRGMKEEVSFDRNRVTSVDWNTYQIARTSDIPEVEIILLNHPENPPTGAGEPASGPTTAAIANAIFDATGVRVRRVPLTPSRIKEALKKVQRA
jgi:nicotinate dehydrogenase subunit B